MNSKKTNCRYKLSLLDNIPKVDSSFIFGKITFYTLYNLRVCECDKLNSEFWNCNKLNLNPFHKKKKKIHINPTQQVPTK